MIETDEDKLQIDRLIAKLAAEWFIRLNDDKPSYEERLQYLKWVKSSPAHVNAMLRTKQLHGRLRALRLAHDSDSPGPPSNVIPLSKAVSKTSAVAEQPPESPALLPALLDRRKIAAVAGVCMVAILLLAFVKTFFLDSMIVTGAGSWQRRMLEDGSIVHLGPNTELRWDMDKHRRLVTLVRGEALFDVARNPARPFIVNTDLGTVRAVGTQFAVSICPDKAAVVVTVAEGKVAVKEGVRDAESTDSSGQAATIPLVANQQVAVYRNGAELVQNVNATRELLWTTGWFDISGKTVGDVVPELNRRNRVQLIIDDPSVAVINLPSVPIKLDDPVEFAQMIDVDPTSRVIAVRDPSGNVHLRRE